MSDTASTISPSISYEVMGPDAVILVFWMLIWAPTPVQMINILHFHTCRHTNTPFNQVHGTVNRNMSFEVSSTCEL